MSENKDNLKLLIEFIAKILEHDGNDWFHDELAVLVSKKIISEKDTGIKLSAVTIKELGSIEKYLNEGIVPIIDYSKISETRVKFQLERDAIEMGKSRLSNFSGPISFETFCKYAHFQAEELINYYYQKVSKGDIDDAKNRIKNHNPKFIDQMGSSGTPYSSISSIPHSLKQFAISKDLSFDKGHNITISSVAKVRNLELHRDSSGQTDDRLQSFILREDYNQVYEAILHLRDKILEALNR